MPKYSNIASQGCRQTSWNQTSPLGNLIGVTNASESMADYNRQFSAGFAKTGIMGMQPKIKKGTTVCILVSKVRNTAKVVAKK